MPGSNSNLFSSDKKSELWKFSLIWVVTCLEGVMVGLAIKYEGWSKPRLFIPLQTPGIKVQPVKLFKGLELKKGLRGIVNCISMKHPNFSWDVSWLFPQKYSFLPNYVMFLLCVHAFPFTNNFTVPCSYICQILDLVPSLLFEINA